jgi:CheY-like chemotaxis protein
VEDLLDVSRIVTGTMRLDVQPTDLAPIVRGCVESVRPLADARALKLGVVLERVHGIVMGSPERLQQVVSNLLTNATKFTPKGGRVDVELRDAGENVELVVRDTGEGIKADLLPYIFDRFRQGDSSSTRAHGGLGLGLALVRHLVELHGGAVHAHSEGLGQGATFVVSLPRARGQAPLATREASAPPATSLHGVRALVVDDDEDSVELTRTILGTAGADVRVSMSSDGLATTMTDWWPSVLVLDIEMPGEDGYGVLARLRTAGVRAPAVALTAYGRPDDRRRALNAGFAMHLSKPVAPEELVAVVARLAQAA